jgi:hypothetical protein
MSVSLVLIPLAVAAVAAAQGVGAGRSADGQVVCEVSTRMRDVDLLTAALRDCGAATAADATGSLHASWDTVKGRFARNADGNWTAHFTGDVNEQRAIDIAMAIDAAYGRQVQRTVLERLRERAPAAGLRLASESVGDDASVRLVFDVEARS